MAQQQDFKFIGTKLGIYSQNIYKKAAELDRLCEVRCSGGGLSYLNFSGSSRTVLCLELAATSLAERVDKNAAVKLSGLTSTNYKSYLKTLERLLNLDSKLGLRDIAVQLGCTEAVQTAQDLLSRYIKNYEATASESSKTSVDFDRQLFSCAALYTACKPMKIKLDKQKLIEIAGVKRSTFDRLVAALQQLQQKISNDKSSNNNKRSLNWLDNLDKLADDDDLSKKRRQSLEGESKDEEDEYEEWKRKILAATESHDT